MYPTQGVVFYINMSLSRTSFIKATVPRLFKLCKTPFCFKIMTRMLYENYFVFFHQNQVQMWDTL